MYTPTPARAHTANIYIARVMHSTECKQNKTKVKYQQVNLIDMFGVL